MKQCDLHILIVLVDQEEYVGKIRANRMQDQEFASELLFYLLDEGASDGNSKRILDEKYKIWNEKLTDELVKLSINKTEKIVAYLNSIDINFDRFNLKGVSHYYALFGFCNKMIELGISESLVKRKISIFLKYFVIQQNVVKTNILGRIEIV